MEEGAAIFICHAKCHFDVFLWYHPPTFENVKRTKLFRNTNPLYPLYKHQIQLYQTKNTAREIKQQDQEKN